MNTRQGILRSHDETRTVKMGKNIITFVLSGEETGGAYSFTEFIVAAPPAPGPPIHTHGTGDEAVYVQEGNLEFQLGEKTMPATAGSVIFVPRGTRHNVSNLGPGPARILVIQSPPGFEGYWREMSELPLVNGKPDPQSVAALQSKYKMDTGGQIRQL
jgi:quercetin dioxygenase-like cupin family protein